MKPIIDPWTTLAIFENEKDARALELFLRQNGFEARTHNDRKWQTIWFLAPPRAVFHVQGAAHAAAGARQLLETDPAAGAVTRKAIHCPSCHSTSVEYPQMTRRFIMPTLLLDLAILLRIIDHQAYCEECHYVWHLRKPRLFPRVNEMAVSDKG